MIQKAPWWADMAAGVEVGKEEVEDKVKAGREVEDKVKQLTLEAEFTLGPGQVGSNLRNQRA